MALTKALRDQLKLLEDKPNAQDYITTLLIYLLEVNESPNKQAVIQMMGQGLS